MTEPATSWSPCWQEVRCRECRRQYTCTPHDDYYGSTNAEDGTCQTCTIRLSYAEKEPRTISLEQVKNICKLGQGPATCKFLVRSNGFECAKGSTLAPDLIQRAENGTFMAAGDNCSGPPDFKPTV